MTPDEITAKIRKILEPDLPIGMQITDDTPLFYDASRESHGDARARGEAGLDSLDSVELVMAIEEEFGIEIADNEVDGNPEWKTIGGIAGFVATKLTQKED